MFFEKDNFWKYLLEVTKLTSKRFCLISHPTIAHKGAKNDFINSLQHNLAVSLRRQAYVFINLPEKTIYGTTEDQFIPPFETFSQPPAYLIFTDISGRARGDETEVAVGLINESLSILKKKKDLIIIFFLFNDVLAKLLHRQPLLLKEIMHIPLA